MPGVLVDQVAQPDPWVISLTGEHGRGSDIDLMSALGLKLAVDYFLDEPPNFQTGRPKPKSPLTAIDRVVFDGIGGGGGVSLCADIQFPLAE
ncbi:MAG: hypothetical protein LH610_01095 [Sphingomonas bacterium]|nr:hypothetical protein [Sphingomonas bacterium]